MKKVLIKLAIAWLWLYVGYSHFLHHNTQNFNGVLVFADQIFLYNVVGCSFLDMSNLITDTVIYITENKFTKLKKK